MSDTTRTHRPTTSSPRYTKRHGIGLDRMRWPAGFGTFRHLPITPPAPTTETDGDVGKYEET